MNVQKTSKEERVDANSLCFNVQISQKFRAPYLLNAIGNTQGKKVIAAHIDYFQGVLFIF